MWKGTRIVGLVAGMVVAPASVVSAAPPQSCAYKYIGTWVYPSGSTVVRPGGTAQPDCLFCPTQKWTCNGNTYYFDGVTATLSPDGRKLFSPGIVATRVGGAGRGGDTPSGNPSATAKAKKPAAVALAKPEPVSKAASCSDISGASGEGAGQKPNCPRAKPLPNTQQIAVQNPPAEPLASDPAPFSHGGAAVESLRSIMPELGKLIDEANRAVNSPNIAPVSQWAVPAKPASRESKPAQPDGANVAALQDWRTDSGEEETSEERDPAIELDNDEFYAHICRTEAVRNGLRSLQEDLNNVSWQDRFGRFSPRIFIRKLNLQWATLRACVRDPLQRAFIEKLEQEELVIRDE